MVSMMFKGQIAIAMTRIGFGEAAPSRRTTCSQAGGDLFHTKTALFRQLLEGHELIGGMHIFPRDVLV